MIRGNNTSYHSLLPPSTPTTTATKSHPITPTKPTSSPRASSQNNNNSNSNTALGNSNTTTMGGGSKTPYGEVTEILMGGFHPSSSDDHDADSARRNSFSESISRRRSRGLSKRGSRKLEYHNPDQYQVQYPDNYGGQSIPFPKDEGIEAILPPSIRNNYQKPPLPLPAKNNEHDHLQRRSRWTCLAPKMFEQAVPPVLTAASSSDDSGQERQRLGPLTGGENYQQQCDYAFDADVWNASPSRGGDIDKNEVSLVDTTFISNSSASTTSSPHPDPIVTLGTVTDDDATGDTILEAAKTKKKSSFKWKKRLKFWKSSPKEKRSTSLEPMGTSTIGGGSPSRKELPNTSDWMLENEGPMYADNNDGNEAHTMPWEPQVMEGDQVECEYRGNISLQDWFMGQEDGNDGNPIARTPSFDLTGLPSVDGEHNGNVNKNESNTLPLGDEEGSPVVAKDVSNECTANTVMELGQYARTMQSKPSRTLSPRTKSTSLGSSLLCALPGLGKKRSKEGKDLASENFPDPGDEVLDYESDNNSYLAVSYTEECAQLVMQQSEDLQDMPPILEPQPEPEAPLTHDAQPQIPPSHNPGPQMSVVHDDQPQLPPVHDDQPQMAHVHNSRPPTAKVDAKRELPPCDHPPHAYADFEDTGYMGDDPGIFRADTDLMSDDLQFLAEHSVRSQSIKTISSSTLGASFGHPAAQLRDDFVLQQRLRHPPPFTRTEDDDPSEKLFKAITQGLPTSESSLSSTFISKEEEIPSDTKARTIHASSANDARPFEREVVNGITYHHYKATAPPPPPPPPPPPFPAQKEASAKAAKTPDDFSIQTPPPIRTMRSNLLNHQKKNTQDANLVTSQEKNTQEGGDWVLQRRDDSPAQVPDEEAQAQAQAAQMYRYYCPADTSSSYRASLAATSAKYRTAISDSTSKYRGACTPTKMPAFELSQPTELSWDNSTAPTLGSRSMSTLSYSEMKFPQGKRSNSLAPTAADIWDVYGPVKQMAKEVGESLCENVYARRGQPSTVPFDEVRPWAKVRKSGKVNYYDRGYRKSDRPNDDHPWREKRRTRQLSQDEASIYSGEDSKPDPPSVFSEQPDTRRQLL